MFKFLVVAALALALVGCAQASSTTNSDTYAGLTQKAALAKAKQQLVGLGFAFGMSVKELTVWRQKMDAHTPKMTKTSCRDGDHRVKAWGLLWASDPDHTPVFVNKGGLVCMIKFGK